MAGSSKAGLSAPQSAFLRRYFGRLPACAAIFAVALLCRAEPTITLQDAAARKLPE